MIPVPLKDAVLRTNVKIRERVVFGTFQRRSKNAGTQGSVWLYKASGGMLYLALEKREAMDYDCLIIDDEKLLADSTAEYFNLFGVKTAVVYSASACREFFRENTAGLMLLDINLGESSGFLLCKELRETTDIPILFISARTSDDDKIIALNIGGDDYVQKPYSLGVLLAKVRAVLKRYGQSAKAGYADGWLKVDFAAKQVLAGGNPVRLTALELKLLFYLMKQENRVVSKKELFENVWEDKFTGDGTLNVHIRKIREAIEKNPGKPEYICTVWGDGYRFNGGKQ